MSILITGGAGFIGSNLTDFLLEKGEEIVVVDDLSSGDLANLSGSIDNIHFYHKKIEDFDFSLCPEITSVIHLAAQVSVPKSISHFKESTLSNICGSICVIDYCSSRGIPLIYASSSALYGNLPFGDDESLKNDLLSPYATDKHAMELYANVAFKLYQLSSIGLRFFNVYGPRQDPSSPYSGVISVFVDRLIKNKTIEINGGHQTRDFIYVTNVVKAIYKSLQLATNQNICETINVLTGDSITIDELANKVTDCFDSPVERVTKPFRLGDVEYSSGSTKKMVELLGISSSDIVRIETGLEYTIKSIE